MERKLKQVILSDLFEQFFKFLITFYLSLITFEYLFECSATKNFMIINFKSTHDIESGLLLIYSVFFIYLFSKNMDKYILSESNRIIESIDKNVYDDNYNIYEFKEISKILKKKTDEIKEKDKELIKNISYISHDIKTPLTVINTNISLLQDSDGNFSDKNLKRMQRIYNESQKISSYIDKIMKISKSELEENNVEKLNVGNLVDFIKKNILIYSDMIEEKIDISTDIKDLDAIIYLNKIILNECLVQLLNNAYEHKNSHMKVEISCKDDLNLTVIDDGNGFDEDMLDDAKKLFVTSNIGRTSGKGYGIGLYYVSSYLDKISGKLKLLNLREGTVAKMIIPMVKNDE